MGSNLLIIGVVIVVFGVSMLLPARAARKRDQAREAWPKVKGTVMSSEVVPQPPLTTKLGKEIRQYDVSVKYQFRTGGQLHFGSAVNYPRYLYDQSTAEKIVAKYPAGTEVTVHHNPEDVRECYLEIEKTAKNWRTSIAVTAVGVVIAVLGLLSGTG